MTSESDWRDKLEELGEQQVRLAILADAGLGVPIGVAYEWLQEKEREAKRREEAARAEQRRIAIITLCAAIGAALISLGAWLFPRH